MAKAGRKPGLRGANLYRYFTNPPQVIKELDKRRWTKLELARYLSVKPFNLIRIFQNPFKYMKYSHIQLLAVALDKNPKDIFYMIYNEDRNLTHNNNHCTKKMERIKEYGERVRKTAANFYLEKKSLKEGDQWSYEID